MDLYAEGDNPAADAMAKDVLEILWSTYPGHPWACYVRQGVMFIRHLDFPTNWGMARKLRESDFSATNLKHDIIISAGEWLERAHMRRGAAREDEEIGAVEGVPQQYQPIHHDA